MSGELTLFGEDPQEPRSGTPAMQPVSDWQVDLIRKALDARGLTAMSQRRQTIESLAGRDVESLRALTQDEALRVLAALAGRPRKTSSRTSTWDERDEDTLIDRL